MLFTGVGKFVAAIKARQHKNSNGNGKKKGKANGSVHEVPQQVVVAKAAATQTKRK